MYLYNEDALQRLKLIEDESIDLILSDVPYKVTSKGCAGTMGGYRFCWCCLQRIE